MTNATRRQFLQSAVVAGTGLALGGTPARAIEPIRRTDKPHLRLSIAAYSYRQYLNLNAKPKPSMTFDDFIDLAAGMELDAVEFTQYYFPSTTSDYLAHLKGRCTRMGLDVSGTAVGNNFCTSDPAKLKGQIKSVKEWVEHTSRLGGKTMRIFAGNVDKGDTEEKARARCIEAIQEACDHAGKYGIYLALENHGGITATIDQVLLLVKGVKHEWFGVNLDTGNFHSADPYADLAQLAPYAVVVQLKTEIQRAGMKKREDADLKRLINMLRSASYRGYIALEYEAAEEPKKAIPRHIEALKKLEFVVAVDVLISETAEMADIVLPGTTFLERYELSLPWVSWTVIALRQPVVPPIFGQPAEYDIIIDLGRRLGLRDANGKEYFAGLNYEDYLSRMLEQSSAKLTLEDLRALAGAVWVDPKGTAYEKHKRELPPEKVKSAVVVGDQLFDKPPENGGRVIGLVKDGRNVQGFPTPSGKVEFYSEWLKSKKDGAGQPVDVLPVYVPRGWQPTAKYPFFLINWKEATHTHSRTMNNPWLIELKGSNPLVMNRKAAQRLRIKDGDEVWVESPYGKDKAVAKLTEGIHPNVVGWQHGFGHWAMGRVAKGKGTNTGQFLPTKSDALSGQSLNKECCVRVTKVRSGPRRRQRPGR